MIPPLSAANGRATEPLSPKQEGAALALAAGRTEAEAARESGAGARTIRTWLRECPAFARRVADIRSEMTARALGRLIGHMTSAADSLGYLCHKGRSETIRLSAARAILELGAKLRETIELEHRIAALETKQPQPYGGHAYEP